LDRLRIPFFLLATLALLLAVLMEIASVKLLPGATQAGFDAGTPGWGIRYLAILDCLLLYTVLTMVAGLFIPRSIVGRIQGIVALVLSFIGCLGTIALAILAFLMLMLMVSLLVAVPFGTLAYMAAWGHFPVGTAETTLALIMTLKLAFCVLLLMAEQSFLKDKGLVILAGVSLLATWAIAFLIDFPPFFLVSIADMIGALVISIVGIVWLIILFVGSVLSIVAVLRSVT
jgi:hypothetical protein